MANRAKNTAVRYNVAWIYTNNGKEQMLLKKITNPKYAIYSWAKRYIRKYEGFSYRFEKNGEKVLINRLRDFDIKTVFDVGANVGDWTSMALANFPDAEVHSFELSKETYKTLSNNVTNQRAALNNFGLSDMECDITYKDYGVNSGVNTILSCADFHDKRIKFTEKTGHLKTGDAYCQEHGIDSIDLLKIDVEGAEHLVLAGFKNMLERKQIKVIQFEYGYTQGDAHFLMKDFYQLFHQHGYLVGPLKPTGVLFGDFNYTLNDFNSGPNFVAVAQDYHGIVEAIKGRQILGYP